MIEGILNYFGDPFIANGGQSIPQVVLESNQILDQNENIIMPLPLNVQELENKTPEPSNSLTITDINVGYRTGAMTRIPNNIVQPLLEYNIDSRVLENGLYVEELETNYPQFGNVPLDGNVFDYVLLDGDSMIIDAVPEIKESRIFNFLAMLAFMITIVFTAL
uniref:SLBB domain-containing protein n=1 Tax=Rhabditophanes sp. KR3021 TaxID=114890 RepID=A0AC35U5N1_9BILA